MRTGYKVLDAMTTKPVIVKPGVSLKDCAKIMEKEHVGSVVVKDNGSVLGIISEQDIVRKVVAKGINLFCDENVAVMLVTHYQRILNYVNPDRVHVFMDGKIVRSGGPELAFELEERGYDWIENSLPTGMEKS